MNVCVIVISVMDWPPVQGVFLPMTQESLWPPHDPRPSAIGIDGWMDGCSFLQYCEGSSPPSLPLFFTNNVSSLINVSKENHSKVIHTSCL